MKSIAIDHRTLDGKSPTSIRLLHSPIDFIAEDHLRLRIMCSEMDRLAQSQVVEPCAVAALLEYLTEELPLLLADEDDDLMPRLLRRAEPEDELPKLSKRLSKEHVDISGVLSDVVAGLKGLANNEMISSDLRSMMRDLANTSRRHLILENAVLIPMARARLTDKDLSSLRLAMMKRRNLQSLFDT